MTSIIAKAGIAVLIALGALSSTVSTASAAGRDFGFGIYVAGPGHDRGPGADRGRHHRDDRRHGWDRPRFGCSPGQAVEKARWSGMRRARVDNVSPRRVVVAGVRHGNFDRMVFANERGCPLIRR
ncbi:MAG: hypothetical protein ACOH2J_20430 [Allorhizobium sp.]